MMKPIGLRYQKIDMFSNFYMLYYHENTDLTEYRTYRHAWYKPKTGRVITLVAHRKLRYFLITHRLQKVIYIFKDY
jgi:hypothetical protein